MIGRLLFSLMGMILLLLCAVQEYFTPSHSAGGGPAAYAQLSDWRASLSVSGLKGNHWVGVNGNGQCLYVDFDARQNKLKEVRKGTLSTDARRRLVILLSAAIVHENRERAPVIVAEADSITIGVFDDRRSRLWRALDFQSDPFLRESWFSALLAELKVIPARLESAAHAVLVKSGEVSQTRKNTLIAEGKANFIDFVESGLSQSSAIFKAIDRPDEFVPLTAREEQWLARYLNAHGWCYGTYKNKSFFLTKYTLANGK